MLTKNASYLSIIVTNNVPIEESIPVQFKILSAVLKETLNKTLREGVLLVIEFVTIDKIPYDTF